MQAFLHLPLRTARLELRPLREADVPRLFEIHSDPNAMRYWDAPLWHSDERGRAMVARDRALATREYLRLGIELAGLGELIGTCALWRIDTQSRRAEIGYMLGPRWWGEGYMHEALCALLDYGFTELDLNRVEADTDPRNERSTRLLERLSFSREGLFRERCIVDGEVSDAAMYGLLRREWRSPRSRNEPAPLLPIGDDG
ncbi:MAG TPA: GNAT family protein [Casimicrobiaceae bacterium]|jgi:ribosomal-protein-alanine N-acetyltransferase|nr:GNAT family protein [Casimicrobiaceae bacterium]